MFAPSFVQGHSGNYPFGFHWYASFGFIFGSEYVPFLPRHDVLSTFGATIYIPQTFFKLDPLETENRYGYVGGNPINSTDPSGLICDKSGSQSACSPGVTAKLHLPLIKETGDILFHYPPFHLKTSGEEWKTVNPSTSILDQGASTVYLGQSTPRVQVLTRGYETTLEACETGNIIHLPPHSLITVTESGDVIFAGGQIYAFSDLFDILGLGIPTEQAVDSSTYIHNGPGLTPIPLILQQNGEGFTCQVGPIIAGTDVDSLILGGDLTPDAGDAFSCMVLPNQSNSIQVFLTGGGYGLGWTCSLAYPGGWDCQTTNIAGIPSIDIGITVVAENPGITIRESIENSVRRSMGQTTLPTQGEVLVELACLLPLMPTCE